MEQLKYRLYDDQNTVLRNTFLLLTLTLAPTILGAYLGMAFQLNAFFAEYPLTSFIASLVVMIALMVVIAFTSNGPFGIFWLLVFTGVVGLIISPPIEYVLGKNNGHLVVGASIAGTMIVTLFCSLYAMTTKREFKSIRGILFGCLTAVIVVSIANIWLQLPLLHLLISIVSLILFSLYLILDVQEIVNGGERNYIMATLGVYLDIVNIFLSILNILTSLSDD